jgi:CIC family chloride channel protein
LAQFWRSEKRAQLFGLLSLFAWSLLVGGVAGLGAAAFRSLIGLIHNLFFLGKSSCTYDANVHTPLSPWGPFVILVPVLGSMGVTLLVRNFATEARGHGVPEVMEAVHYNRGVLWRSQKGGPAIQQEGIA